MSSFGKESAQLEREVEAQRNRVEERIGEIRERLSPGQLVDELLSFSKEGGQHFAANLGQTITANPLPATLLGVSLVWLMSGQNGGKASTETNRVNAVADEDYPYATINGRLRRTSHAPDDTGEWYSSFADDTGQSYRARSNESGHRAGHFVDDAGRKLGGFIDETGHRVRDFRDEAGNRLEEAAGWASSTWSDLRRSAGDAAGHIADKAAHMGGDVQAQADRVGRMLSENFRNQPLVAGALAFAAGAALGAALPHTRQEDEAVGKLADSARGKAAELAAEVYEEGKVRAGDLYDKVKDGAAELYDEVASEVAGGNKAGGVKQPGQAGEFH